MRKIILAFLAMIIMLLLFAPALQQTIGFVEPVKLYGKFVPEEKPQLTFETWNAGKFQEVLNSYAEEHVGFRSYLIKMKNQLDFDLFRKSHAYGVVVGKEDYLYEKWFIYDYTGANLIGEKEIGRIVNNLEAIKNYLKVYNTKILVILGPGKGFYYPEYIPDHFEIVNETTNYSCFLEHLNKSSIAVFDVNGWFMDLKGSEKFPLFPKTGTHWSDYGAKIAADSIIKKTEELWGNKMNQIHFRSFPRTMEVKKPDDDLEKLMNLIRPIPKDSFVYPVLSYETDIPKNARPDLIVISDSFFWNIYDGTMLHAFDSVRFWYYFSSVFPIRNGKTRNIKEIDIIDKLKKADVLILLTCTSGLKNFGYGFVEEMLNYMLNNKKDIIEEQTDYYLKKIKSSDSWMDHVRQKAEQREIPFDSMLLLDADYLAKSIYFKIHQ